ncbi:UNVERIFIED_CONTAM: hypothetical protein GTU68_046211 [Idotea baltica]|nr:hypothetical protein [Idotea baltica]
MRPIRNWLGVLVLMGPFILLVARRSLRIQRGFTLMGVRRVRRLRLRREICPRSLFSTRSAPFGKEDGRAKLNCWWPLIEAV